MIKVKTECFIDFNVSLFTVVNTQRVNFTGYPQSRNADLINDIDISWIITTQLDQRDFVFMFRFTCH